jgi:hypothetical protein
MQSPYEIGKLFKLSTKNGKWINLSEDIQYGIILGRDYSYGSKPTDYTVKTLLGEQTWLIRETDIEEIL